MVRNGYRGPVYATPATCELVKILLLDSGRLQEEEAEFANRHGFSKHSPALPLYTEQDTERALKLLRPVELHHKVELAEVITRTALRRGITLVPSFAVGRAQLLMYHLYQLKRKRAIPDIPIYLSSPMATDVTLLYQRFRSEHRLSLEECEGMCHVAQFVRAVDDSRALDQQRNPAVIIAASGMATGGRVVHHLKALAPNPINTLLMPGFQAGGPRGAQMLRRRISQELGWSVSVPEYRDSVELSSIDLTKRKPPLPLHR